MVTSCSFACGCIALLPLPAHGSYTAEEASVAAVAVAVGSDEKDEGNIHSKARLEVLPVMLCNALRSFCPLPLLSGCGHQRKCRLAWQRPGIRGLGTVTSCSFACGCIGLLRLPAHGSYTAQEASVAAVAAAVGSDEMDEGNIHSGARLEVLLVMLCNALRSFLPASLSFRLWTPKGMPTRVARTMGTCVPRLHSCLPGTEL